MLANDQSRAIKLYRNLDKARLATAFVPAPTTPEANVPRWRCKLVDVVREKAPAGFRKD